ncbi:MFS transporter [Cellulomonas endophytica]|uniref:MFS transporter n=1 Tax=Cellulomonas endophytica TaxID=2494735 RepID=UPI001F0CBDB2|nr:MFS transporter [Cellulomonas endophytica]
MPLVLVAVVLAALNLRLAVAVVSPVLDLLREDMGWTPAQVGLLGALPPVAFAVLGVSTPAVARRLGTERALVAALAVAVAGEVGRSTATGAGAFLAWSALALAGMGAGNVLVPPLVKRWLPDRVATATAAYLVAMALGSALPPLVVVPLAQALGWRPALGVWALVGVVAVVPWLVVLRRARAGTGTSTSAGTGAGTGAAVLPAVPGGRRGPSVWRSGRAWAMAVTFAATALTTYVLFAWLPQLLVDAGVGAAAAGRYLALFAGLGLVSSFVAPRLTQRARDPWGLVVAFAAVWAAGLLGLLLAPTTATALWAVLLGLGPSAFPMLLTLVTLRSPDPATTAALSGMVQGTGYALAAAGPVLVGLLHDATRGWSVPVGALLGVLVVQVVAARWACRPGLVPSVLGAARVPEAGGRPAEGRPTAR